MKYFLYRLSYMDLSDVFVKILNMSIAAGWMILAVLVLRLIFKKSSKNFSVALWGLVAARLLLPRSIKSIFSLIPSTGTVSPYFDDVDVGSGFSAFDSLLEPVIDYSVDVLIGYTHSSVKQIVNISSYVWLFGMLALIIYLAISYFRVRKNVKAAVLLRENIYQSDNISSPFVFGLIKPKVYLPYGLSESDMSYVIAHESAHIKRKDYIWKLLGFLLLCIYWFNPLIWLSYVLLCRDIELACDEKVIKGLDRNSRADYSQTLLNFSANKRVITACPLAFGEVGVKNRIKSILSYKKTKFWLFLVAIVLLIAVSLSFLTDPANLDHDQGINGVSFYSISPNQLELCIDYSYCYSSYSIRVVPEDEGMYIGDGMIDYDGSIGKYRIMLEFRDVEPSSAFRKELTGHRLDYSPIPVKTYIAYPSDHGFVLYLGFDEPVYIEETSGIFINPFTGTLTFSVMLTSR